jgi:hypothetical protein
VKAEESFISNVIVHDFGVSRCSRMRQTTSTEGKQAWLIGRQIKIIR